MTLEVWVPIPSQAGYEASSQGRIRSLPKLVRNGRGEYTKPSRIITGFATRKGYRRVRVNGSNHLVHRLVAEAFHGPSSLQVRHRNGRPADNRPENLEYGTNSQNQIDSVLHGTHHHSRKTRCKRGHPFTPENTIAQRGGRACRACKNARERSYRER